MSTETETTGSETASSQTSAEEVPSRKRRGCFGCFFLILLIALPLLGFLLNGPLFRWGAEFGINKAAESQGLSGSAHVEGTIISGFEIRDAKFRSVTEGEGLIRSASIQEIGIDYSLGELIQARGGLKWLDEIRISQVDAHVVLDDGAAADDTEAEADAETDPASEKKDLAWVWELLEAHYDLKDISVRVEQGDKAYVVTDLDLELNPGGEGELSIKRIEVPGMEPRESIETRIALSQESLTLGPLKILEEVEIASLKWQHADSEGPLLASTIRAFGATLDGSYQADGQIAVTLVDGAFSLPALFELISVEGLGAGSLTALDLDFSGDPTIPSTWNAEVELGLDQVEWAPAEADALSLAASISSEPGQDEKVTLKLKRKGTSLDATATLSLDNIATTGDLAEVSARVQASFASAEVGEILEDYLPDHQEKVPVAGALAGTVDAEISGKKLLKTHAEIGSDSLAYDGIAIDSVRATAELEELDRLVFDAGIKLDDATSIDARGELDPESLAYEAEAELKAAMAGRLKTLLAKFGFEKELSGEATVSWKGAGESREKTHRGAARVATKSIQFEDAASFDAMLEGKYDNLDIHLDQLSLNSEELQFAGALTYLDSILDISQMELRSGELSLLQGKIKVPLAQEVLKSPQQFFSQDGEIAIDVHSHELALSSLLGLFQQSPPVECLIGINLQASGSPSNLQLDGKIVADQIAARKGLNATLDEKVSPARVALEIAVTDSKALFSGQIEQPQIQPFLLKGTMPFVPAAWLDGSREITEEAVSFSAVMEESQLAFLTAFAPALTNIDGSIGLDVRMGGTLGAPDLGGKGELILNSVAFASPNAPSIRDVAASLHFKDREILIDRFEGVVAGGQVGMKGKISLPEGSSPEFDLRLGGHEVLVFRSDSVSARTDLNLTLKGPYPTATLGGTIGITSSLFYKDIDLLPIGGLPIGGGESAIPEVDPGPKMPLPKSLEVGVPIAPFQDWGVDVKIITLDPFRVAGNLAQAEAECDLAISGTLGAPVPNGRIWVREGRLVLPFSKINLSNTAVQFDAGTGFNGIIAMRAKSKVGDYWVSIFARDRILSPEITFTSVPPLPREDILSLLASGSTRDDLAGGGGAAATKAAIYYFKSLTNKEGKIDPDAPPSFVDTLEERTSVSIGKTDTSTGEMQIDTTIRLWRQSYFGLSLGQEGSYRGILKYLFRFR